MIAEFFETAFAHFQALHPGESLCWMQDLASAHAALRTCQKLREWATLLGFRLLEWFPVGCDVTPMDVVVFNAMKNAVSLDQAAFASEAALRAKIVSVFNGFAADTFDAAIDSVIPRLKCLVVLRGANLTRQYYGGPAGRREALLARFENEKEQLLLFATQQIPFATKRWLNLYVPVVFVGVVQNENDDSASGSSSEEEHESSSSDDSSSSSSDDSSSSSDESSSSSSDGSSSSSSEEAELVAESGDEVVVLDFACENPNDSGDNSEGVEDVESDGLSVASFGSS